MLLLSYPSINNDLLNSLKHLGGLPAQRESPRPLDEQASTFLQVGKPVKRLARFTYFPSIAVSGFQLPEFVVTLGNDPNPPDFQSGASTK